MSAHDWFMAGIHAGLLVAGTVVGLALCVAFAWLTTIACIWAGDLMRRD